jgi:hypothetical protein
MALAQGGIMAHSEGSQRGRPVAPASGEPTESKVSVVGSAMGDLSEGKVPGPEGPSSSCPVP